MPKKLKPITHGALKALTMLCTAQGRLRPGVVGADVFRAPRHRQVQHYARLGGKVLRELERGGFARREDVGHDWGWVVTAAGRNRLRDNR